MGFNWTYGNSGDVEVYMADHEDLEDLTDDKEEEWQTEE